jgi:hypothetical protein
MGKKAKPIFAKPRAKILETKPKRLKYNQHFEKATTSRKQTNVKPRIPNPQAKKRYQGQGKYCQTQSTNKFIIKSNFAF